MAYWNIDLPTSQWKRAKVFLANAASFVVKNPLSTVTIVILVASSIVVTRELSRDIALIEAIDLPPFVQDLGLTENVAAFRLRDSILRILREVNREGLESQIAFLSRGGQESHIAFLPNNREDGF